MSDTSSPSKKALPYKYYSCYSICVLGCICMITFGSYWVYDIPGAIFYNLQKWFGHEYTSTENLNLYSVYSWPNTVLAFFGGFIIDRITGVRWGNLLFCGLVLAGQLVFSFGVISKVYWVCVLGRFVFGLGGESLTVSQNTYVLRWFGRGPGVAFAFGIVLSFVRLGSAVNFAVTPSLADSGVPLAIWVGTGFCCVSMLFCSLAAILDKFGEKKILQKRIDDRLLLAADDEDTDAEEETVSLSQIRLFPLKAWLLFLITLFFYAGFFSFLTVASDIIQNTGPFFNEYDQLPAKDVFANCHDYNGDPPSYWQVNVSSQQDCENLCNKFDDCSGYQWNATSEENSSSSFSSSFSFSLFDAGFSFSDSNSSNSSNSSDISNCFYFTPSTTNESNAIFVAQPGGSHYVTEGDEQADPGTSLCFKRGHRFSPATSSLFLAIPNFVAIVGSPLCGKLIDNLGRAMFFIIVASIMLGIAHVVFLGNEYEWWFVHPIPIMVWIGIASSMGGAALWPTLPLVVPRQLLGTGYGLMTSIQNLGLAAFPLLVGFIQDSYRGTKGQYSFPLMVFIATEGVSLCLTLLAFFIDLRDGKGFSAMNASAAERLVIEEQAKDKARQLEAAVNDARTNTTD